MEKLKTTYGPPKKRLVITLNGLADDAYRQSRAVDNTIDRYIDALVQLQLNVTAGAPAGDKNCLVYAYGTVQTGAPYSGGANGIDSGFGSTVGDLITNCPLLGIANLDAANEKFISDCFSVASSFGGVMPEAWGIIVMDQSGQALAAVDNKAWYQGIYGQWV